MEVLSLSTFYEVYVNLCAEKNVSLSAAAESIGLSRTSPNGWKKGKLPQDRTLAKLAAYFNVTVPYLKGEEETEKPTGNADELSDEEIKFIEWYRSQASDKEKALVRMIVDGDK
jgi:transcriptional regulator with XRE-family HTH domain